MIQTDPPAVSCCTSTWAWIKIYVWRFDEQKGELTPAENHVVSLPPGDGPRHFHFHPKATGSTPSKRKARPSSCSTTIPRRPANLPANDLHSAAGFCRQQFCSEILVSADGRFVYAGNRLHDSVGIFSIGKDGTLKYVGEEWTRGNYPRSFSFDPTGQFFYCCNRRKGITLPSSG